MWARLEKHAHLWPNTDHDWARAGLTVTSRVALKQERPRQVRELFGEIDQRPMLRLISGA